MTPSAPKFTRRQASGALASLAAGLLQPGMAFAAGGGRWGPPRPFSWDLLVERARRLAGRPYVAPRPSAHAALDSDAFVRLAYGAAEAVTGTVRLFPPRRGVAPLAVSIHVVDHGVARRLIDTHGLFGADRPPIRPAGACWRPTRAPTGWPFLGASYFRCSGTSNRYGLSARAISVDTGLPGRRSSQYSPTSGSSSRRTTT
jgi:Periplasmic glucans biosynthesis protein